MSGAFEEFWGTYDSFDWDEAKRAWTLRERGIDFVAVVLRFFSRQPIIRCREMRGGEERWQAIGPMIGYDRAISVIYVERDAGRECRIISVRIASKREREAYDAKVQGR